MRQVLCSLLIYCPLFDQSQPIILAFLVSVVILFLSSWPFYPVNPKFHK